ncbi:MAG TPA: hypothetical protein VN700_08015 [Vicinamibacterales bacterium]|nr:hypothetical protein [Vicinamibacterales bacterium]
MPTPPGISRRHRWFIGVMVALLVAPMLLLWSPLPLPVTALLVILALPALLIWISAGQSWVWAAGPPRPPDAVGEARRVGRRIMVLNFVVLLSIEVVSWAFGARQEKTATEALIKAAFTGAIMAFGSGKMAEYLWSRRPADAPVPWLFRIWPLRD